MEWDEIKQSGDIFLVKEYVDKHPESENDGGIIAVYEQMRQKLLTEMKTDPTRFSDTYVLACIKSGILTREQMVSDGLATYNTFDKLAGNREILPDLAQYTSHPDLVAKEGCTDVYFFGVPSCGKTSILMGLTGVEGSGVLMNHITRGGSYASALNLYLRAGVLPYSTPDNFITTIHCNIEDRTEKAKYISHYINFVEMSGGQFVRMLNNNQKTNLKDMVPLLRNNNRKVFFLIVDPTRDIYNFTYNEPVKDADGNVIGVNPGKLLVDQTAYLAKFADLCEMPENKGLMKNVDAIHFIVTKADTMGETEEERNKKAYELLWDMYPAMVQKLVSLCKKARLNRTTDGTPCIFTFSLGKFYLGNVFEYDNKDSLYLIDALRHLTQGTKETALRKMLGLGPAVVKPLPGDYGVKLCNL